MLKLCECCKKEITVPRKDIKYCKECARHNKHLIAPIKYAYELEVKALKQKYGDIVRIRDLVKQ